MIQIGNLIFANSVMNAACSIAKTTDDVEAMCRTKAGAVLVGSITAKPRKGNPEPRWYDAKHYAMNSYGMPNEGAAHYEKQLPKMAKTVHHSGKKIILNVAGFNSEEFLSLAQLGRATGVDVVELNFACPNTEHEGRLFSFDIPFMDATLKSIFQHLDVPITVKLSPYSDPIQLREVAQMLKKHPVAAIVTSNSLPNSYMTDEKGDFLLGTCLAGLHGRALLPIALGQVKQFRELLPARISVIGVGGIESKADVGLYLDAGATAVQVATYIVRNGHRAIDELI